MEDINQLVRKEVRGLRGVCPQLPDRTIDELKTMLGREDIIKLSLNENPYGTSPKAIAAIAKAAAKSHLYHDPEGKRLKAAIGELYGFSAHEVFLSNGADEAVALLAQAFLAPGDEAVIISPTFGQYAFAVQYMGACPVMAPVGEDMAVDFAVLREKLHHKTKMIFICNPNNPTGVLAAKEELLAFLEDVPENVIVVLDEAYGEFVTDKNFLSGLTLIPTMPNVVVVRTFSKVYGLAGLRLGYAVASVPIIQAIDKVRCLYNVNMLAEEAALAALEDRAFAQKVASLNAAERDMLNTELTNLGFKVYPSQTNFIFLDSGRDGEQICQELLSAGIVIRSGIDWNLPTHLRISIGSKAQNQRLLKFLHKICLK